MKRPLLILVFALLAGSALFASSYFMGRHVCEACAARSADNLDWLRQEFQLNDADLARVRELHNGYIPECAEMCAKIAAKKEELDASLNGATNVSEVTKQKLSELAFLRSQCQAQMLQHFIEVSRAMPPGQGARYLSEMERLTIGSHEQTEQTMSMPSHAGHVHGEH